MSLPLQLLDFRPGVAWSLYPCQVLYRCRPRPQSALTAESPPAAQVEAKYPALLFKQQLDAFVQKIFPMLRDNVKKEITPQLAACIHAPRAATTRGRRGGAAADVASPRAQPSLGVIYQ